MIGILYKDKKATYVEWMNNFGIDYFGVIKYYILLWNNEILNLQWWLIFLEWINFFQYRNDGKFIFREKFMS